MCRRAYETLGLHSGLVTYGALGWGLGFLSLPALCDPGNGNPVIRAGQATGGASSTNAGPVGGGGGYQIWSGYDRVFTFLEGSLYIYIILKIPLIFQKCLDRVWFALFDEQDFLANEVPDIIS